MGVVWRVYSHECVLRGEDVAYTCVQEIACQLAVDEEKVGMEGYFLLRVVV